MLPYCNKEEKIRIYEMRGVAKKKHRNCKPETNKFDDL